MGGSNQNHERLTQIVTETISRSIDCKNLHGKLLGLQGNGGKPKPQLFNPKATEFYIFKKRLG